MVNSAWITVNRFCNFRCPWCYAENKKYSLADDMPIEFAKSIVDFLSELGVNRITILGGEPTYYKYLPDLITYIKERNIFTILVTNGYKFAEESYLKKIVELDIDIISFSLKASNEEQFQSLTKVNAYDTICKAIYNLSKIKRQDVVYSSVVTLDTADNLVELAQLVSKDNLHKKLNLSFCRPSLNDQGVNSKEHVMISKLLADKIISIYDKLNDILDGMLAIEQSLPVCVWPIDFLEKLSARRQIYFGCTIRGASGLVFDTKGEILLCNFLPDFPVGKFKEDFSNKVEFYKFWESDKLNNLRKKIFSYPNYKCTTCFYYEECGGGCPLHLFVNDVQNI